MQRTGDARGGLVGGTKIGPSERKRTRLSVKECVLSIPKKRSKVAPVGRLIDPPVGTN